MNTPEIGSKWAVNGDECEVTAIRKRGRGYQVDATFADGAVTLVYRLRDFLKAAKPL